MLTYKKISKIWLVVVFFFVFFTFIAIREVFATQYINTGVGSDYEYLSALSKVTSSSITITPTISQTQTPTPTPNNNLRIDLDELGFIPPTLGELLTFAIRVFFVIAGISALFYMLLGAYSWVTSGGEEETVNKARSKIQSAVVGLVLIVAVLGFVWTLEQAVFRGKICLGLSCPITIPVLLKNITN